MTKKKIDNYKESLARVLADYDNFKKRTEAERTMWIEFSSEKLLIKLIPILDNFELALKHTPDQGLGIAVAEFTKIFAEEGLEPIEPKVGDVYNHELHEVIETVAGGGPNTVVETVLKGWKYKTGKVIRFAKVKVCQK
ncbi:nucleotide exchange factor GrpE [Candidatus Woesebacteria bacterium RIFOXYA1_FULL_43_9]|uniref:Protein GrpE n=1 Tax=Candidatus Woesebacteria bacterium RIFOXYA1_FULL_43_9 TaxID=1802534 RepID=A0A1F8CMD3_9BACT|nr:MAG: nucleotide exchange factor GrpE [Candidatus Woesebacteria bacterium RIFOXYA1_FULL_43_9]